MHAIITYQSIHHQNTAKIAQIMSSTLHCRVVNISQVNQTEVNDFDLIGFGSGIYFGRFHENLFKFVESLPNQQGKKAFIFSTSGIPRIPLLYDPHREFRQFLKRKGFNIIDEFNCPGWDTYPKLVKPFGGIRKGHPNNHDLKSVKNFARRLKLQLTSK